MTKLMKHTVGIAFFYFAMLLSVNATGQTLYERLGGQEAIECWIDKALPTILRDRRINDYFAGELNADQSQGFRDALVDFSCAATGGPCTYSGRDMSCAHAGLGIGHGAFTYFLQDLERAAKRCRRHFGFMPDPAYSELNKVLLSLRPTVVQDDPGENPSGTAACP